MVEGFAMKALKFSGTGSCAISSSSSGIRGSFSSVSSQYFISAASRCSVWAMGRVIQSSWNPRPATSSGTMTFQALAVLADPGFEPSA